MNIPSLTPGQWQKIYIPEASCAFDAPYCIHVRLGDPRRLLFYLEGGGASWDRDSAKWPGIPETGERYNHPGLYSVTADNAPSSDASIQTGAWSGILSTTEENPLADWSMVYVCYATGDFHTGTNDLSFIGPDGSEKVLHHHGYLNLQKVLTLTRELFSDVDSLLIAGESAGAYGVAAVSGDVMEAFPACSDVTLLCDSALMSHDWADTVRAIWKAPAHIADAVQSENFVVDWFRALHQKYGDKPRYLYACGHKDETLVTFGHYLDDGRFMQDELYCEMFRKALGQMCGELKAISPRFSLYVHDFEKEQHAPGVKHCIFANGSYTAHEMDGVTPRQWLSDAMNGNLYDVGLELVRD
jgi:hypothetical protein